MPAISFEFYPPKTDEQRDLLDRTAKKLRTHAPEYVSCTFGAGGSTLSYTSETVRHLAQTHGFDAAPHLSCMGGSREEIRELLRLYRALGQPPLAPAPVASADGARLELRPLSRRGPAFTELPPEWTVPTQLCLRRAMKEGPIEGTQLRFALTPLLSGTKLAIELSMTPRVPALAPVLHIYAQVVLWHLSRTVAQADAELLRGANRLLKPPLLGEPALQRAQAEVSARLDAAEPAGQEQGQVAAHRHHLAVGRSGRAVAADLDAAAERLAEELPDVFDYVFDVAGAGLGLPGSDVDPHRADDVADALGAVGQRRGVAGGQRAVGGVRLDFDQARGRIDAVEAQLRLDGVAIGGKRAGLDQDRVAFFGGVVKTHHHQMQIDRQRVPASAGACRVAAACGRAGDGSPASGAPSRPSRSPARPRPGG